jgi:hypothetical protein
VASCGETKKRAKRFDEVGERRKGKGMVGRGIHKKQLELHRTRHPMRMMGRRSSASPTLPQ